MDVDAQHAAPDHASEGCHDPGHCPGQREVALDIDAHGHGDLLVVGNGPHRDTHAATQEEPGEAGEEKDGNAGTHDGYSDYGSLGTYEITAGFGVCGIEDDLDDDSSATERRLFPTEGTDGRRCAGDDDWLRVPGVSGTTVTASLSVQDEDLTLDLIGPNGTTVLDTAVATSGTAGDVSFSLTSNGDGSDHAWGNHLFLLGGGVQGRRVYGAMPDMSAGSDDFASDGNLIPRIAVDQYGATLGRWFGVPDAMLDLVFPNLAAFDRRELGFMLPV